MFAKTIRADPFLPESVKLQELHENTTLSIMGHREFAAIIAEYKNAEKREQELTQAQRAEVRIQWLKNTIEAEAEAFARRVRRFRFEDERSSRAVFDSDKLVKLVNSTDVPQSKKNWLIHVINDIKKRAGTYDDDMAAIQHVWAHRGFGGIEGEELEKAEEEFSDAINNLTHCDMFPNSWG
nr:hypothetical protein [Ferrimicrobium acidiphilum]